MPEQVDKTKKILVIDDEHAVIDSIIGVLGETNPNYKFYFANSGVQGIIAAERHHPEIIITDWEMSGLSGIETIIRLKKSEITKNIPIIMLSGKMTSSENLQEALNAGAIDFIRKPIDPIELTARVNSMLLLASYYRQIISQKNQELTSTTINLVKKNEERIALIKTIKEIELEFGEENEKLAEKLKTIYQRISFDVENDAWAQFETYFKNTHPTFMSNLLEKHADLLPAELKIAILVSLNMSIKEIAAIAYMTDDSVKTSRSRLRKKMELNRNENLTTYLQQF